MMLIAFSESSTTNWCLIDNTVLVSQITTSGINPFYQSTGEIQELIVTSSLLKSVKAPVEQIYFYGAGCSFPEKKATVEDALRYFYPNAEIEIESDLVGAARGLFQHEKGIACILGTGSNTCYYDGTQIVKNIPPLGFMLDDQGSGGVLGKLFIADCMKGLLPQWLCEKFFDEYNLTPEQIMETVYMKPFPSRFLASFTPFIAEHIDEPVIFNLVFDSFDAFFVRNVLQYDLHDMGVGFVGSVAYHFKDILEIVAFERNIIISQILESPVDGLMKYHTHL